MRRQTCFGDDNKKKKEIKNTAQRPIGKQRVDVFFFLEGRWKGSAKRIIACSVFLVLQKNQKSFYNLSFCLF